MSSLSALSSNFSVFISIMSTNTILMDCNRGQATATNSDETNTSLWTNEVSSGIRLDPGDTVSVHSAFINEIGSGADTIEFLGKYLTTTQLRYTVSFSGPLETRDSKVYDNQCAITCSFYKCADADNVLILPRLYCWNNYHATSDDGLPAHWNKFESYDDDFKELYRRTHDGRRYTIYQQDTNQLSFSDIAQNSWQMYRQRVDVSVDTGYNTPADISSRLTETFHASTEPQQQRKGDLPFSLLCTSPVYQQFNCANTATFSKASYDARDSGTTYRHENWRYIGVLRPDLFDAGRKLNSFQMLVRAYDPVAQTLTLTYPYNAATTQLWRALFEAQAAQFDADDLLVTPANTRFIHVNYGDGAAWTQLGHDTDLTYMSVRQPVRFDASFADSYSSERAYGVIYNDGHNFIQFRLKGTPVFSTPVTAYSPTANYRRAGWDIHFSAFANDCVMLWSGYQPTVAGSYTSKVEGQAAETAAGDGNVLSITSVYTIQNQVHASVNDTAQNVKLNEEVKLLYLGAINPVVSFDTSASRFFLSGLHTARKLRNDVMAGSQATNQPNPEAGGDIYQVNPSYLQNTNFFTYNPEQRQLTKITVTSDGIATTDITKVNLLDYWTVFDASSGIFIEDWGVPAAVWDQGLWGKLGFTYEQLHASGHRQARATNTSVVMSPASTNADVNATQTLNWTVNAWGAPMHAAQLPTVGTRNWHETVAYKPHTGKSDKVQNRQSFHPGTITQDAVSTRITALKLPVKQTSSYWTIRSSLIDNSRYFSSSGLMPVIAVVDKSYSGSDFYFMSDSNVQFTITKSKVLTAITTSVHLPDGSLARTDGNSCVIYQITKGVPPSKPPNK